MKRYQAELLRYFPYHIGDTCVFENTEIDSSLVVLPVDKYNSGSFPYHRIYTCGPNEKCSFDKEVMVHALWNGTEKNKNAIVKIDLDLQHPRGSANMQTYWYGSIVMGENAQYAGRFDAEYPIEEILSIISDTLVLPILDFTMPLDGGPIDISSQGAYLRLVKDHGLTDFSLDGTTVWCQVKK